MPRRAGCGCGGSVFVTSFATPRQPNVEAIPAASGRGPDPRVRRRLFVFPGPRRKFQGMRLQRLEIPAFKSFPDRSELTFDTGVPAIVGPNGCGKSNVVDALTWVLGEQSAKSLRGDRMEDVIFGGSDARKP